MAERALGGDERCVEVAADDDSLQFRAAFSASRDLRVAIYPRASTYNQVQIHIFSPKLLTLLEPFPAADANGFDDRVMPFAACCYRLTAMSFLFSCAFLIDRSRSFSDRVIKDYIERP